MGLTLNTNSLTVASSGGGSSGVTLAQVQATTPWQYIETITASTSSTLELTNSNISNFDAFFIYFDNINLSSNVQTRMRLYLNNILTTDNGYKFSTSRGSNNSSSSGGESSYDSWIFGGQSYEWMRNITGTMYINGKANNVKALRSDLGAGNSGNSAIRHSCGGQYNTNDSASITGFYFFTNTGNYSSGQLHLYGMNKHD